MTTGEIDFLDVDLENESYYEVELWESGDCEGHFFKRKKDALKFFNQNKNHESDCIKYKPAEYLINESPRIIKENI